MALDSALRGYVGSARLSHEYSGNTTLARLVCDEATARRLADSLSERFDAVGNCARSRERTGAGTVEIHFESPPDEDAVRLTLSRIGRRGQRRRLTFEQIAARDWVAASLAELKPVEAGRFTVHGAHDRARVAPNRIGIEIEAALAFGTGHHGTTRGCLLALDWIAKTQRPRRSAGHRHRHRRAGDRGGESACGARCWRATSTRKPCASRATNARLNGVSPLVECICANGIAPDSGFAQAGAVRSGVRQYPAGAAQGACRAVAAALAPGAHVVLSGLLAEQENAALAAYRPHGLRLVRRIPLGEWVTLVLSA